MSGILGLWHRGGRPIDPALLDRLLATLDHRGVDGKATWIGGPVGLGCQHSHVTPESLCEKQPFLDPLGAALVFDGRLDNREELLAALKNSSDVCDSSPDAALVLATYRRYGEQFAERLTGDFALGLYDPSKQWMLLARDAVGVRPLYYYKNPNLLLFASEIKALLPYPGVPSRPNDVILAEFIFYGLRDPDFDDDGQTFFEGIHALLPGHIAVITPEGFNVRRYWDFDPSRRIRLGSFQEYAEGFRFHFERAVKRRLRSAHPVAVSVSGGVDSSSILCVAKSLQDRNGVALPPVFGVSLTHPDDSPMGEQKYLDDIERHCGICIERISQPPRGFLEHAARNVWHTETPMLDSQGNASDVFLNVVRQRGARVLLTGHWGDQFLLQQTYLVDLFRRLAWRKLRAHVKELARDVDGGTSQSNDIMRRFYLDLIRYHLPYRMGPLLRKIKSKLSRETTSAKPHYLQSFREKARGHASAIPGGVLSPAYSKCLYENTRSRNYAHCMELNNKVSSIYGLDVAFPFLDRDLVSFLMGVPGDIATWQGVPRAILREALVGILPESIRCRRGKADFTEAVNGGVAREYSLMVEFLKTNVSVLAGYAGGERMGRELNRMRGEFGAPDAVLAWSLRDLVGLKHWLELFCEGKNRQSG